MLSLIVRRWQYQWGVVTPIFPNSAHATIRHLQMPRGPCLIVAPRFYR